MCTVNCLSDDTGSQTPLPFVCDNSVNKYNQFSKCGGWSTLIATQMVILLLLVFGFFFAILIYCKTCSRDTHQRYSAASNGDMDCRSLQSNSIYEPSVDRPPSYNAACSAPPLYESPFNSISMFEAPPVYPETLQQSKRVSHPVNQTVPITNYI